MRGVVDERATLRLQNDADPEMRARRRRAVRNARAALLGAVALIGLTLTRRVEWAPHQYSVGYLGMVTGMAGVILVGVSFMTFMRSPFRMPLGERLFRLVWLGPLGRVFLRASVRGVASARGSTIPVTTPTFSPAPADASAARSLEARVAALEQWRATISEG